MTDTEHIVHIREELTRERIERIPRMRSKALTIHLRAGNSGSVFAPVPLKVGSCNILPFYVVKAALLHCNGCIRSKLILFTKRSLNRFRD